MCCNQSILHPRNLAKWLPIGVVTLFSQVANISVMLIFAKEPFLWCKIERLHRFFDF